MKNSKTSEETKKLSHLETCRDTETTTFQFSARLHNQDLFTHLQFYLHGCMKMHSVKVTNISFK